MDGKNRALDNIFVERFWRSLKYEDIYLKDYLEFYNGERFHASLDYATPNATYAERFTVKEKPALRAAS